MKTNTETKAADTLLQKPIEVTLGGKTYTAEQPTLATLIMASEAMARVPAVKAAKGKELLACMAAADRCLPLAEIAAVFILGARQARQRTRPTWWKPWKRATRLQALAKQIADRATPKELHAATAAMLSYMQAPDFFALTTFLTEANLLRPTKVEMPTT